MVTLLFLAKVTLPVVPNSRGNKAAVNPRLLVGLTGYLLAVTDGSFMAYERNGKLRISSWTFRVVWPQWHMAGHLILTLAACPLVTGPAQLYSGVHVTKTPSREVSDYALQRPLSKRERGCPCILTTG